MPKPVTRRQPVPRDSLTEIIRYLREEAACTDEMITAVCEAEMIVRGPQWADAYLLELLQTRPVNPTMLPWERRERQKLQAALKVSSPK